MYVKIDGKRWKIVRLPVRTDNWGFCDSPETPNRRIIVDSSLTDEKELDIFIHEMLHARCYAWLDETFVEEMATELAAALWKIGYRKEAQCGDY